MTAQCIAFRTDATNEIGTGHFMRCLTLANELQKNNAQISFVSRGLPKYLKAMLHERQIDLYELPDPLQSDAVDELNHSHWLKTTQDQDALQTIALLGEVQLDWLIVDHYALDYRWEKQLRYLANHIFVIDDLADRSHDCNVMLDQNFYANMDKRYEGKVSQHCLILSGPKFSLLRDEFRERRKFVNPRSGEIKSILVFFGGIDVNNYTTSAIHALKKLNWDVSVTVVLGQQHPQIFEIQQLCKTLGFVLHVQSREMALLMAQADLAISAGGSSLWERFCLGLPSICIVTADNQRQQVADLHKEGLIIALNNNINCTEAIYEALLQLRTAPNQLHLVSKKITEMVDGYGVSRVAHYLVSCNLFVRLATESDSKNIFTWRNHPLIRSASLSTHEINWVDHEAWFSNKLMQSTCPILIGEISNRPVGVVRFDVNEKIAEVSIYLVPEPSNRGLGRKLMSTAEKWLSENFPKVETLRAFVIPENGPSIRLFSSLQYAKTTSAPQIEFEKKTCQII
jgi:UDP-2,4-diacetamido-2,4,6-trideoxy-beta-L-altropyranose hydrolase